MVLSKDDLNDGVKHKLDILGVRCTGQVAVNLSGSRFNLSLKLCLQYEIHLVDFYSTRKLKKTCL